MALLLLYWGWKMNENVEKTDMKTLSIIMAAAFLALAASGCNLSSGAGEETGLRAFAEESCCPDDSACQDDLWCNGHEICDCWGECKPGSPPECDDYDDCTVDTCDEGLDMCLHTPLPGCCHEDRDCNDHNPCTTDVCILATETCVNTDLPDGTVCRAAATECHAWLCQTGLCTETVDVGAACTYEPDSCFSPGTCWADGLCHGVHHPPPNDNCGWFENIPLNAIGSGMAVGTTTCALDDYAGTCGGANAPDVVYSVSYTVSSTDYQLYSYNTIVDADFNSLIYARTVCDDAASQVICNDDCLTSPLLNCGFYGLGATDSAFSLGPRPSGSTQLYYLLVDGRAGGLGTFFIRIERVQHSNNPCRSSSDNVNVVDATAGGVFRGNINGYANDMMDLSGTWLKTACHGAEVPSMDWPGRAWFRLAPAANTTYRVVMDEVEPVVWFDSVIEVWNNTLVSGCNGIKTYVTCSHIAGQDNLTMVDGLLVPAGSTYLVGLSSYARPSTGNYRVEFIVL
jgi:hypothetical protein